MAKNATITIDAPEAAGKTIASTIETRIPTAEDILMLLAEGRDGEAQAKLDIIEKLEKLQAKETSRKQRIAQAKQMAREEYDNAKRRAYAQQVCANRGHRRDDGRSSALVAQRDSNMILRTTCQRCQKNYVGVGDGVGQLPVHFMGDLTEDTIGGVMM